jgi:diguanylate cyclase (GGDEF)-like protein
MLKQPVAIVLNANSDEPAFEKALHDSRKRHFYRGAVDALQGLEQSPADVIVIAQDLEDMDGLELAEAIRDIDAERQHFSYIILFGPTLSPDILEGFDANIDAFVTMDNTAANTEENRAAQMQLLAKQVKVGGRISPQINHLQSHALTLQARCTELEKGQLLDPLTGLGNRRLAEQSLADCIRQVESRGGAVCFLMISIENYPDVVRDYDKKMADQLIIAVSNKIQQLVRPMDIVTYFETGRFALVLIQPTIEQCTAECYQRIYDGVNLKSYKTPVGYLPANIGMSICASEAETGPPNLQLMIRTAQKNLDDAFEADKILVKHLSP